MSRGRHVIEITLTVNHPNALKDDWVTCYYVVEVGHSDGRTREYVPTLESLARVQYVIKTYRYLGGRWVRRDYDIQVHSGVKT